MTRVKAPLQIARDQQRQQNKHTQKKSPQETFKVLFFFAFICLMTAKRFLLHTRRILRGRLQGQSGVVNVTSRDTPKTRPL
jgi:hypothetical protein